ncbi:unnamed protein product [Schistosoma turkestanicum]|nr:unnamed protein product [Schistosoma turkestanicum]
MCHYLTLDPHGLNYFLNSVCSAIEASEYDIIPHIDDSNHKLITICDDAFGICKCTSSVVFDAFKSNALESVSDNLLNYLLLVAPNTTTFWNYKRKALLNNEISAGSELRFTQLILNKYPRSYETIFHRQWVIQRYNYISDQEFLSSELELCGKFADKYRCNYGLWQYRRFLLSHQQNLKIYKMELNNMNTWLAKHPTDVSGWSYLESVLDRLVHQSVAVPMSDNEQLTLEYSTKIIQSYFEKVHNILELYPERECVWMFSLPATKCLGTLKNKALASHGHKKLGCTHHEIMNERRPIDKHIVN